MRKKIDEWDWESMQIDYDSGMTYKDLISKYKCSNYVLAKGKRMGLMVTRTPKEAYLKSTRKAEGLAKMMRYWTPENRAKVSAERKAWYASSPDNHPLKVMANRPDRMSYPERMAYCYFEDNNFNFEHQVPILSYCVDFLIDGNMVVEVDGAHWHDPEKDAIRDELLKKEGYNIIRFPAKEVISHLNVYFKTNYNITLEESIKRVIASKTPKPVYTCGACGIEFTSRDNNTRKYCSLKCSNNHKKYHTSPRLDKRKVPRPTSDQLIEDLALDNWTNVGKKYNVSDNAVRKWCRSYDLPTDRKLLKEMYAKDCLVNGKHINVKVLHELVKPEKIIDRILDNSYTERPKCTATEFDWRNLFIEGNRHGRFTLLFPTWREAKEFSTEYVSEFDGSDFEVYNLRERHHRDWDIKIRFVSCTSDAMRGHSADKVFFVDIPEDNISMAETIDWGMFEYEKVSSNE